MAHQVRANSNEVFDSLILGAERNVYRNPLEAKSIATTILEEAKLSGSELYQAKALKVIGGSHFIMGDYDVALENFLDSYSFFLLLENSTNVSRLLSNVGLVCKNIGDFEASLDYYNEALDFSYTTDTLTNSRRLNNIGVAYQHLEEHDAAKYFLEESLLLKTILNDKKGMANTLTNLGNIAGAQGNFDLALEYHQKSYDIEHEMSNDEGIAKSLDNIGSTYLHMKNYEVASKYAERALRIGEELGTKVQLKQTYQTLAACHEAGESFKSAYCYQSLLTQINESLMNEDISRKMGRLESKLELASHKAEIEKLSFKNQLSELEMKQTQYHYR
ncbi:MAG: tetratricopeptide (TPR) repeat protein [Cyclobacteriaceae bacterium]